MLNILTASKADLDMKKGFHGDLCGDTDTTYLFSLFITFESPYLAVVSKSSFNSSVPHPREQSSWRGKLLRGLLVVAVKVVKQ